MLKIKRLTFNAFAENTYFVWDDSGQGVIIDPGCQKQEEVAALRRVIEQSGARPVKILLTHGHFDHIFGVEELAKAYGIKIYLNPSDKPILQNWNRELTDYYHLASAPEGFDFESIADGDKVSFGDTVFEVIGTPGHTPGGVCYYSKEQKVLFTGDTLFAGTIGRTDTDYGDYDKLIVGIMEKLMWLDSDTAVYPGHGPSSSIAAERTTNPFLQPFNEKEGDIDNA